MTRPILWNGVVMDNDPYVYPPDIPAGQTCAEYRAGRPRRRSWLRRTWRRLHGH